MAAIRPHYCKHAYIDGSGTSKDMCINLVGWGVELQLHNPTVRPTTGSGCEVLWCHAIEKQDVTDKEQADLPRPDPANQPALDIIHDMGVWASSWAVDLSSDQEISETDWMMWCVPYVETWPQPPEQADLLRKLTARYQTTDVNQIAKEMCDEAWTTTRSRRQTVFGQFQTLHGQ
eukprot:6223943-Pyramimonas_sp.AAC.1